MVSTYTQLCPVLFGVGAIEQLGEKAVAMGAKKALCVFDAGVKKAGLADRIVGLLEKAGIAVACFDEVIPDPTDEVVEKAGAAARAFGANLIVGLGGGSSLDTAKAASALNANPSPVQQYWSKLLTKKTPLILIPTVSGTGSESTIMSVVVDQRTHIKEAILNPGDLAIVDPQLTVSAPASVTAASGMDALAHAVESYTTNCGNPRSDVLSLEAMRLIVANLEAACKDGSNIAAREKLSLASNFAGISFSDASVHIGHAAAHELGNSFRMPHGVACALTLPEVIRFVADALPERSLRIAEALGVALPAGASGVQAADLAIARVHALMTAIGIRSLKAQGIAREAVVAAATSAVEKNWFVCCAVKKVDVAVMADFLGKVYDNY